MDSNRLDQISVDEHLMRYQKALGYLGFSFHVSSNTVTSYNDDSRIIVFDLEKIRSRP